ncbi:MAG: outer membrane beta-barrel protein [Sphingomonadaceae bacterium]|nr:outer membrane beta-barrel protein [Sphingomonadaceae bacterium]
MSSLFGLTLGLAGSPLCAQDITRTTAIDDLPRPGYEPRTIRTGGFVIMPLLVSGVKFDNNILASDLNRKSDVIFQVEPSIEVRRRSASSNFYGRTYATLQRYAENTRENTTQFGAELSYRQFSSQRDAFSARASFDRAFERRGDPEAIFAANRRVALINTASGDLEYSHQGSRLGVTASIGATKINYLSPADSDRDMTTYRAALRGSLNLTQRFAVFIQPYVNRRDPSMKSDRFMNVDRTTTTYGVLGGVAVEVADRLTGELGVGVLHANPKDLNLAPFTGLAASGRVTWRPRTRTAISANLFRGDVATIRSGAIGRIDTRFNLGIDQEARHNVILRGSVGLRSVSYRGDFDGSQRYYDVDASARYLLNRQAWIELSGTHVKRTSTALPAEEFRKWQAFLKVGLTY